MEAPPEYVKAPPWSEKQRLTEEKTALGFYLSGHLFNAYAEEVRKFVTTKLASLEPSREPRLMAGMISGVRTQMTQRGKILIVTLDDGTATVDVTVYNELYEAEQGTCSRKTNSSRCRARRATTVLGRHALHRRIGDGPRTRRSRYAQALSSR